MIAILDYGAGNLTSVLQAFKFIGQTVEIVSDAQAALAADQVVFPGVGSAASGMNGMRTSRLDAALLQAYRDGKPILAICLGMQMLLDRSEEDGGVAGFGLLPGTVRKFSFPPERRLKVHNMGWNAVNWRQNHPVFAQIPTGTAFYFVHSYYAALSAASDVWGETEYGGLDFASAIGRKNLIATQFHPERSGEAGLQLLRNFSNWDGTLCC